MPSTPRVPRSDLTHVVEGRRERSKSEKYQRIFRATEALFGERGYDAVATREIAERADVASGTLFRYAATKAELLMMVYNEALTAAVGVGAELASTLDDPVDQIIALVEPMVATGERNTQNTVVYQRELLFGSPDDKYRMEGLATVVRLERLIADRLLAVPAADASRTECAHRAAMSAARAIFAMVHMAIAQPIGEPSNVSAVDVLREQISFVVTGFSARFSEDRSRELQK